MITVRDIINIIEEKAPLSLAESWDNPGFMVGDENAAVTGILTALDCDMNVVREAEEKGCNLIITHHPLLFRPLSFVTTESEIGKIVLSLASKGISLYSAHTNLDCAQGGVNDNLCRLLNLKNVKVCDSVAEGNLIRVGETEETTFEEYAKKLGKIFGKDFIRIVGDRNKPVKKVAVCGGGGGDFIFEVSQLCDVYVTGDIKYHMARTAAENGLCLAIVEHYETEHFVNEIFGDILKNCGVKVFQSEENKDIFDYILI